MKKHIAVIVSLFITSVTGFSQDFLNRYQQLDENNIEHFFKDWKHYSDSCANNIVIKDTMVFNFVNKMLDTTKFRMTNFVSKIKSKYIVLDKEIVLIRYPTSYIKDGRDSLFKYKAYDTIAITPKIHGDVLYLTKEIHFKLMRFIGPNDTFKHNNKYIIKDVDKERLLLLQKYIVAASIPWDVWIFSTDPKMREIRAGKDWLEIMTDLGVCGEFITYYIDDDEIVDSEITGEWII